MNEDREGAAALTHSATFARASRELGVSLEPQELFEGWVDEFLAIYHSSEQARVRGSHTPTVAIVDYMASATPYEFEEFRARFERRGLPCLICDVSQLVYRDDALYGSDVNPQHPAFGQATPIDAVYRRAVTGEIVAELEAGDEGTRALVRAAEQLRVCMIGGFRTHVAHCKQLFAVLHLPETAAFLTDDETAFIRRHVPYTTRLDRENIDLDAVKADRERWIIKPEDGYGSKGVYAGGDQTTEAWSALIDEHSGQHYIIQEFCEQYATPNTRLTPRDTNGQQRFATAEAWASAKPPYNPKNLEPWNNLTGLYLYNGRFSGIFVRAGQTGIIAGFAGGLTIPSFLANYTPQTTLALRTA
jgi:hypothetical protein